MFALLAAIVWLLAAIHIPLGGIDLLFLGLCLLALHIAFGVPVLIRRHRG